MQDLTLAENLRHLELLDRDLYEKTIKKVSKLRPDMAIVIGETLRDSMAKKTIGDGYYESVYLDGHSFGADGDFKFAGLKVDGRYMDESGLVDTWLNTTSGV